MDRNLALEFVRVTEAAAIAAASWVGRGDKTAADQAAVDEMRSRFNHIDFSGTIRIGEGEKDEAPMLYTLEKVGTGNGPAMDLAVDPLEATDSVAHGRYNAISVIVAAPPHTLLYGPDMYMEKLAVGPEAAKKIDLDAPIKETIKTVAKAKGKDVKEISVIVLDRRRHDQLIREIRDAGARVQLITDGDVAGAIAPSLPDNTCDLLMGIGASAEAVLASAAIKPLGGQLLCRFKPKNDAQKEKLINMGITDISTVYSTSTLTKGNDFTFTATGVIEGPLLKGVNFTSHGIETHSLVIRASSKTVRYITAYHHYGQKK